MPTILKDSTGRRWQQADITAVCDAAMAAFHVASPRVTQVRFRWRTCRYVARRTSFRLKVYDTAGNPVCCRWW